VQVKDITVLVEAPADAGLMMVVKMRLVVLSLALGGVIPVGEEEVGRATAGACRRYCRG
jgi:hypothetical protein